MKLTSNLLRKMINEETQILKLRRSIRRMINEVIDKNSDSYRVLRGAVDQSKEIPDDKKDDFVDTNFEKFEKKFGHLVQQRKNVDNLGQWVNDLYSGKTA